MKKLSIEKILFCIAGLIGLIALFLFIYYKLTPEWYERIDVDDLLPEQYLAYSAMLGSDPSNNMGEDRFIKAEYDESNDKYILWVRGNEGLTTNSTKSSYLKTASDIFKSIFNVRPDKIANKDVEIVVCGEVTDAYGNASIKGLLRVTLNEEIEGKINWNNFDYNNLLHISKKSWTHDLLN